MSTSSRTVCLTSLFVAFVSACGGADSESTPTNSKELEQGSAGPFEGEGSPWVDVMPKATCGDTDAPEPGLQGIPQGNKDGYRCNLKVHGKAEVASWMSLAWYEDCAYVNATDGTTVLDVSDTANPKVTAHLDSTGMRNSHESMKVHTGRGLLAAYAFLGTTVDVYDVASDCRKPKLISTIDIPGGNGHAGNFSVDGRTYYASPNPVVGVMRAIDLDDPLKPAVMKADFPGFLTHDVGTSADGTRGYFMQLAPPGTFPPIAPLTGGGGSGLTIVDLTEVQARRPVPKVSIISETSWQEGSSGQGAQRISYRGKPFLIVTDEVGNRGLVGLTACGSTNPTFAMPRIFDISDEKHPVQVSRFMLEAEAPEHCDEAVQAGPLLFGFGSHYCSVDRVDDPRLAVCSFWESGIRVFDIRNPWRPKEVAYFNPGNGDMAPAASRIDVENRQIWVSLLFSGFYVLDFTGSVLDDILSE